jgi:outer membrane protein OmpA-like peptidoglycan-associated protein
MTFGKFIGSVTLVLGLAAAGPALAQDASGKSAEELRDIFQKQKTRGLIITPGTESTSGAADVAAGAGGTAETPVTYVELDKSEQINIQIRFDFDSAAMKAEETPKLVALCEAMKTADVQLFRIVGHTDASGSDAYNQRLSLLRAEEVKRHMVSECGIDPAKLEAVGVGEQHPFDPADPKADANRRVEFQALS